MHQTHVGEDDNELLEGGEAEWVEWWSGGGMSGGKGRNDG